MNVFGGVRRKGGREGEEAGQLEASSEHRMLRADDSCYVHMIVFLQPVGSLFMSCYVIVFLQPTLHAGQAVVGVVMPLKKAVPLYW